VKKMAKRLFLEDEHKKLKAKFFEFADWWMPLEYVGTVKEHLTVRNAVGIFDISHMGRIIVNGKNSKNLLQYITSNDINKLYPGKAQYSLVLTPQGTIMDDIIVYMISEEEFLLIVNAINTEKIFNWLLENNKKFNVYIEDITLQTNLLAIQGPKAEETMQKYTNYPLSNIPYYHFKKDKIVNKNVLISRTGYTGEDGFEIVVSIDDVKEIFNIFTQEEKITPCGLGARDTLRLEMGYPLYGHELDENTTPWEANLGWVVKLEKGEFIGKDALIDKRNKKTKVLNGFELMENGIPRAGYEVYNQKEKIGYVTSGNYSPILKRGIGLLYTNSVYEEVRIKGRDKLLKAKVVKPPFIKNTSIKKGEKKNVS